jgi:ABC-2 type transport system ATP-binding protein
MSPPAVEILDLVKRYGTKKAVDRLSLVVEVGAITAVLGPNGAGKTTTIETCEGYRTPDSGTVRVLGLDPQRDERALKPRVGVMLQSGGVYPSLRATAMLKHVARLHAHPLDLDMLVDRLGLGSAGRTPCRRLSGGQQQRLSLAMAVIGRPEVVFLDEPTAGLDPQARRATWELIEELQRDGVTVVITTHAMDEAERLADQVVVVDHGAVVMAGSPAELMTHGAQNSLHLQARPGLDLVSLRAALPAATSVEETTPGAYVVTGEVDAQLVADVTAWCAAEGVLPQSLAVERRTLEDVFLELTGHGMRA